MRLQSYQKYIFRTHVMNLYISLLFANAIAAFPQGFIPNGRIVGGVEVTPFKYNFMASIQRYGIHRCGGTRYTGNIIITAGHCTHDDELDIYDVVLHRHNLELSEKEEHAEKYNVLNRTRHPNYISTNYQNDVALWKIDAPNKPFNGIKLDLNSISSKPGTLLTVAGWGYTKESGSLSNVLREVKVPVVKSEICKAQLTQGDDKLFPKIQFCAGYPEGNKDACQADSGGPLFSTQSNVPVLVGIVSWGNGCAKPNLPGVYTKVSVFADWIQKTLPKL